MPKADLGASVAVPAGAKSPERRFKLDSEKVSLTVRGVRRVFESGGILQEDGEWYVRRYLRGVAKLGPRDRFGHISQDVAEPYEFETVEVSVQDHGDKFSRVYASADLHFNVNVAPERFNELWDHAAASPRSDLMFDAYVEAYLEEGKYDQRMYFPYGFLAIKECDLRLEDAQESPSTPPPDGLERDLKTIIKILWGILGVLLGYAILHR